MSDFLEINCPSCGRVQVLDGSQMSGHDVSGTCASCGEQIVVTREGVADPAAPARAARGGDGEARVHLKMSKGSVENLSAEAVQHGVEARRILPWDQVSDDGQRFEPISKHPMFREHFMDADFAVTYQRKCTNHDTAISAGNCRRCGRGYCSECIEKLMQVKPQLCPACNGGIQDPDPRLREKPPWKRPDEVALFPIVAWGWILTLSMGLLIWLAGLSVVTMPLYLLVLVAAIYVVMRSARGEKTLTLRKDLDGRAFLGQAVPAVLLTIAVTVPVLFVAYLAPFLGIIVMFPLGLLGFVYYPMALGLLVLMDDPQRALQPRTVIRTITAIKEDYILCLMLLLIVVVAVLALHTVFGFIPGIRGVLGSLAKAYGIILQAHLIGWFVYMNRERLLRAA